MGVFNRAAFETNPRRKTVAVPTSQGDVLLRSITALDLYELRESFSSVVSEKDRVRFTAHLLAKCIVDEQGQAFLTHAEVLEAFEASELVSVGQAAIKLCGLAPPEDDESKN